MTVPYDWEDAAEVIARLWMYAVFPHQRPKADSVIFDPPLTEPQTDLLGQAIEDGTTRFLKRQEPAEPPTPGEVAERLREIEEVAVQCPDKDHAFFRMAEEVEKLIERLEGAESWRE